MKKCVATVEIPLDEEEEEEISKSKCFVISSEPILIC